MNKKPLGLRREIDNRNSSDMNENNLVLPRTAGRWLLPLIVCVLLGCSSKSPDMGRQFTIGKPEPPKQNCASVGMGSGSVDGTQYVYKEISPGKCQWVVNVEATNYLREQEAKRSRLYFALRTRVLTTEEWGEVIKYGDRLNIDSGRGYYAEEKSRELNNAYLQQFLLRMSAMKAEQK